ncbi:T9SS type A sorting domain-containing protein [Prolixibacteraceae bacterium JC049]|nr:T9SS type A sorting domain-containing protein [Prolixibacteraceae bacterium JC049]
MKRMKPMSKWLIVLVSMLWAFNSSKAQEVAIPQSNYSIKSVSSDNSDHPAKHAIDGKADTFWSIYNPDGYSLPGVLVIDLGKSYPVTGFSYLPNADDTKNKTKEFEFYVSDKADEWGDPEAYSDFDWSSKEDVELKRVNIGAVSGRFVKVVWNKNYDVSKKNIHTAELVIYQNPEAETGKKNQSITFDTITEKLTTDAPWKLEATSSSGLPVTFKVKSGPATIENNTITLTGAGIVEVEATQDGDDAWFASSKIRRFTVIDLSVYKPEISTNFDSEVAIEMDQLRKYPIYFFVDIEKSDRISIESLEAKVGEEALSVFKDQFGYVVHFEPKEYGSANMTVTATASTGVTTTQNYALSVTEPGNNRTLNVMDKVLVNFPNPGRTRKGSFIVPQFIGGYKQIIGHFKTTCPNIDGACDDWDRWAYLEVKGPNGQWIELIRYITPYDVGCEHTIDLTDYASVLQGNLEYKLFIDTWGTGGWEVTLDLEYIAGTPEFIYSNVDVIWDGTYDFGNPNNLQTVEQSKTDIRNYVRKAKLNLVTTGHGWGQNNTGNAAEFYYAKHHIAVDGKKTFLQDMKVTCNPNPDGCTGQKGTWHYDRAGWCPGSIAKRYEYDFSDFISRGTIALDYIFQEDYKDLCHPQNPDCVSKVTCPDCKAGYNPHYHVDAHLISYSNDILTSVPVVKRVDKKKLHFEVTPNPSNGVFKIYCEAEFQGAVVTVHPVAGPMLGKFHFKDNYDLSQYQFDVRHAKPGVYFVVVKTENAENVKRIVIR